VDERESARNRLRVLDAFLLTLDHWEEFDAPLSVSADRAEAITRLGEPPWSFGAEAANWVLDQPVSHRTLGGRSKLAHERDELRAQLDGS
jgi:hypothetical protein